MKSHTVPKRLLEQFAYEDAVTRSPRLWRYERGRRPYRNASPATATRVDGHFADPGDAKMEAEIEKRLAYDIENPVNSFLSNFDDPSFAMKDAQREQMTRYIGLLFNRTRARREGTSHLQDMKVRALNSLLGNDAQLRTVAAHWNIDAHFRGLKLGRLMTGEDVARAAMGLVRDEQSPTAMQKAFAGSVARAMSVLDQATLRGEWRIIRTTLDEPYILSDAPVTTWQRINGLNFEYGVGFHHLNVEVLLPLSPRAALHILPAVRRTQSVIPPKAREVNMAQAAFAYTSCFGDRRSDEIDRLVQQNISTVRFGKNAFTVWHINYDDAVYQHLMLR
jgi:hypothetical protein